MNELKDIRIYGYYNSRLHKLSKEYTKANSYELALRVINLAKLRQHEVYDQYVIIEYLDKNKSKILSIV